MVVGRQGVRQWLRVSKLKWRSEGEEGLKEAWVAAEEMRDLGLDNSYIYRGYFCNFKETGFYSGWVSGRVSDIFDKTRTCFRFFFFKNPYPTLFLIEPSKTQPIRVGPSWVPADRAKISIPIQNLVSSFLPTSPVYLCLSPSFFILCY